MFYKDAFSTLGGTPLVELTHMTPNPRVHILAKVEGQNVGGSSSIKDRIALNMLEEAEKSGQLTHDRIILEATSGNTGIALAWWGYAKGYRVILTMPESVSVERRRLIEIYGGKLILTPGDEGTQGAIKEAYRLVKTDSRYYMPDQFSNPANPQAHYETTGAEIIQDCPYERIDAFVAGIGTGGTIMGVSRRLREKFPNVRVIGVEPPVDDPIQGLKNVTSGGFVPPVLDLNALDQRLEVTSRQAESATTALLREEGIFGGQSAGAAVYQAVKTAREMDSGVVVTILPDGGLKYLSMNIWHSQEG